MFHRFRAGATHTTGDSWWNGHALAAHALKCATGGSTQHHPPAPAIRRRPYLRAPHVRLRSFIFEKTSFDIICCEAWQKPRGWRRVWWRRVNASCAVERCASPDSARLRARSLGRLARDIHSLTFPRRAHPAGGSGRCTAAMREGRCPRASMCTRLA